MQPRRPAAVRCSAWLGHWCLNRRVVISSSARLRANPRNIWRNRLPVELQTIVVDIVLRTTRDRLKTPGNLLSRLRLANNVRATVLLIANKHAGCKRTAQVAVEATSIHVEPAWHVPRPSVFESVE